MRRLTIRWRMTLWYGGVLALVLLVFSAAVYLTMREQLATRADRELFDELLEVRQEVEGAETLSQLEQRLRHRFSNDASIDFEVRSPAGESIFRSERLGPHSLPLPPNHATHDHLASVTLGDLGRWRVASQTAVGPEGTYLMQVARSLAPEENAMRELLRVLLLVGPPALAAALGGGYWLARRALAPVDRMTRDADQITATRLNVRLPLSGNDDELERLAHTLNRMIERLEHSFQEMQRFTADAAHELRTPLAVIRNTAEVALRSAREPEEYRHVLENLLEETDQLTRLAGQLLYLCREDSGLNPPANTLVRLDELVREVADQIQIVAREKGLALTVSTPASCQVPGDADRLRRALFNLIDNAVKYTDTGGTIALRVTCNDRYAQIIVADNGRGIASEHVPHIFKRFYRGSGLPKSNSHGTGLGLAICKAIVESHAGRLEVHSKLGEGSQFTILLPTRRRPCPIAGPQPVTTVDRGRE